MSGYLTMGEMAEYMAYGNGTAEFKKRSPFSLRRRKKKKVTLLGSTLGGKVTRLGGLALLATGSRYGTKGVQAGLAARKAGKGGGFLKQANPLTAGETLRAGLSGAKQGVVDDFNTVKGVAGNIFNRKKKK